MQNTRPAAVAIEVVCGRLFTLSRTSPSDAETVFISIEEFQESRPLFASVTVFLNVPLLAGCDDQDQAANRRYRPVAGNQGGQSKLP
jgi:hypothetical protein